MKNLILISSMLLVAAALNGQTLQKGSVLGFHNGTFTPNPDVTMNQCLNFITTKYFPEVEKNFPGVKCYLLKGVRGESKDCIGFIYLMESDALRDKYWKPGEEGNYTELGNAAMAKIQLVNEEMNKLGKMVDKYTDWIIQ